MKVAPAHLPTVGSPFCGSHDDRQFSIDRPGPAYLPVARLVIFRNFTETFSRLGHLYQFGPGGSGGRVAS